MAKGDKSTKIGLDVSGEKALLFAFAHFRPAVQRKILRPGVRDASKLQRNYIKSRMPRRSQRKGTSGLLRKKIRSKPGTKGATVYGVTGGEAKTYWVYRNGVRVKERPANILHLVAGRKPITPHVIKSDSVLRISTARGTFFVKGAVGHPGYKPTDDVRKALKQTAARARQATRTRIREGVSKEFNKAYKAGKSREKN